MTYRTNSFEESERMYPMYVPGIGSYDEYYQVVRKYLVTRYRALATPDTLIILVTVNFG
jgi:hypothetical protein